MVCPPLPDYEAGCNDARHCEYTLTGDASDWRQWDVWIWVPPGSLEMGASLAEEGSRDNEQPVHSVTFAEGFFVAKYEAVVEQYEACEDAEACEELTDQDWFWDGDSWGLNRVSDDRGSHPQNGLMWEQAETFCAWLAPGGRLPTEAEWEYAASGPSHRKYPWGDSPEPTCDLAVFDEQPPEPDPTAYALPWSCEPCTEPGCSGTRPVGSRPGGASYVGALDMAGNVWELVQDCRHDSYDGAPAEGSAWLSPCSYESHGNRGGSFNSPAWSLRTANRGWTSRKSAAVGARCVRPFSPVGIYCNTACPDLPGYGVVCNAQDHCEYTPEEPIGSSPYGVLIWVPPSTFPMGAPEGEGGADEHPQHDVTFATGYFVDALEVTADAFAAFLTARGDNDVGRDEKVPFSARRRSWPPPSSASTAAPGWCRWVREHRAGRGAPSPACSASSLRWRWCSCWWPRWSSSAFRWSPRPRESGSRTRLWSLRGGARRGRPGHPARPLHLPRQAALTHRDHGRPLRQKRFDPDQLGPLRPGDGTPARFVAVSSTHSPNSARRRDWRPEPSRPRRLPALARGACSETCGERRRATARTSSRSRRRSPPVLPVARPPV